MRTHLYALYLISFFLSTYHRPFSPLSIPLPPLSALGDLTSVWSHAVALADALAPAHDAFPADVAARLPSATDPDAAASSSSSSAASSSSVPTAVLVLNACSDLMWSLLRKNGDLVRVPSGMRTSFFRIRAQIHAATPLSKSGEKYRLILVHCYSFFHFAFVIFLLACVVSHFLRLALVVLPPSPPLRRA
jgi:hypothetical protein